MLSKGDKKMAKVLVEMEFDLDGFDDMNDSEKFYAIEEAINSGAESTFSEIYVNSIEIKNS